jgi:hypothetical protein
MPTFSGTFNDESDGAYGLASWVARSFLFFFFPYFLTFLTIDCDPSWLSNSLNSS